MKYLAIFDTENEQNLGSLVIVDDASFMEQLKSLKLAVARSTQYYYAAEFKAIVLEPLATWNQLVVSFICSLDPEFLIFISESQ